jgi:hypothetical protein
LASVAHHRQSLRDAVEQLERMAKSNADALADADLTLESRLQERSAYEATRGGRMIAVGGDDLAGVPDDHQHRQLVRLRAKCACLEEIAAVYRTGLLALYADGFSYGSAQFHNVIYHEKGKHQRERHLHPGLAHLVHNGWFERELDLVRKSFEDEIRLLDSEVIELRGKLKQSTSYVSELRKRFEDNMKILYRSGNDKISEGLLSQVSQLTASLHRSEDENRTLMAELESERTLSKRRHSTLVDELARSISSCDAAASIIRRLEEFENDTVAGALEVMCHSLK